MFVQVKDYFAVLFRLEQKSPFLKKHLKSDTVKLDIYCQGMNKSGVLLIRFYYSQKNSESALTPCYISLLPAFWSRVKVLRRLLKDAIDLV